MSRSAQISVFLEGSGTFLGGQNSKCQDLPKFQFSGGLVLGSQIEDWYSWQFGQKILEA